MASEINFQRQWNPHTSPYCLFLKAEWETLRSGDPHGIWDYSGFITQCHLKWRNLSSDAKSFWNHLSAMNSIRRQHKSESGWKKIQRIRKKRDPCAPRKAITPFFCFLKEKRDMIKATHPDYLMKEVTAVARDMWKSVSKEDRQRFYDISKLDQERYKQEMQGYREGIIQENQVQQHNFISFTVMPGPTPKSPKASPSDGYLTL